MKRLRIQPGGKLRGETRVPGDKSISHRAVMLSALADGDSRITGLLTGTDVLATARAFQSMGVSMDLSGTSMRIGGVGRFGLRPPAGDVDLGNSGTAMRLLAGLLSGQGFEVRLVGDKSLSRRPMWRVTEPLREMGADIDASEDGTPPLLLRPVEKLSAIRYALPVASAQVKSAVMLAGLYAVGRTCVRAPGTVRDHTERMLRGLGVDVTEEDGWTCLEASDLHAADIKVPADFSSAAFPLVAASVAQGSELRLTHVGVNPTRTGLLTVLKAMGADIQLENPRVVAGEPVADLIVRSASLRGVDVGPELVPLAIDEIPVLCVAAALAEGETRISGAGELRYKESDRIRAMAAGLGKLGVRVAETEDGMVIEGREQLAGGVVESCADHRVAMSFAVAGLRARDTVEILETGNIETSFPSFAAWAREIGMGLTEHG